MWLARLERGKACDYRFFADGKLVLNDLSTSNISRHLTIGAGAEIEKGCAAQCLSKLSGLPHEKFRLGTR